MQWSCTTQKQNISRCSEQHSMSIYSDELARAALSRSEPREAIVADIATRYWLYPATNDQAKTLIFIHGYRGNHHGLEAIAGALPDFNIVIPDLPGFGKSAAFEGEHTVAAYVTWLQAFINHIVESMDLKVKPTLVGHSFGSILSAAFAAQNNSISHLVLINPVSAPALEGPKSILTQLVKLMFWLSGALPLKSGLAMLKSWPMVRGMSIVMTKTRNRELRQWVHAQHDANFNDFASRRVAIEGYLASISHNVGEYAPDFMVPTTLIVGAKDDITSVKQQEAMASTIPGSWTLTTLRGVGHLTHYEKPFDVAAAIRADLLDE
jgi:pimeloyl-ACP methyl ester carboxylesterase